MTAQSPRDFKHTTLAHCPETHLGNGVYTPKAVGITLLDETPGFTGIYLRDKNGGLWPARTVARNASHYTSVIDAWAQWGGVEDRRTIKGPTVLDRLRERLEQAGVKLVMKSDAKLIADSDGFYEYFGSDACAHVGFEAIEFGDGHCEITVKCPVENGGRTEVFQGNTLETGVMLIIGIFSPMNKEERIEALTKIAKDEQWADDALDDLVHSVAQDDQPDDLNQIENEQDQDEQIGDVEENAAEINNGGHQAQIRFLVEAGVINDAICAEGRGAHV